jgi:hypothetical protein
VCVGAGRSGTGAKVLPPRYKPAKDLCLLGCKCAFWGCKECRSEQPVGDGGCGRQFRIWRRFPSPVSINGADLWVLVKRPGEDAVARPSSSRSVTEWRLRYPQRVQCARGSGCQIRRSSVDSTLRSLREIIHRSRAAAVLAGLTALKRRRSDSETTVSGLRGPPPTCLCGCVGRCGAPRL